MRIDHIIDERKAQIDPNANKHWYSNIEMVDFDISVRTLLALNKIWPDAKSSRDMPNGMTMQDLHYLNLEDFLIPGIDGKKIHSELSDLTTLMGLVWYDDLTKPEVLAEKEKTANAYFTKTHQTTLLGWMENNSPVEVSQKDSFIENLEDAFTKTEGKTYLIQALPDNTKDITNLKERLEAKGCKVELFLKITKPE